MRSSEYQKRRDAVKINNVLETIIKKVKKSMNKPVQSFRDRGVDVAVWTAKNGGYSFTIRKTYKNKETQQYIETKYYYKEELEKLIELLQQAVKYASNRAEHDVEHMASGGFSEGKSGAKHEEIDMDNLPF
jgi:transposase